MADSNTSSLHLQSPSLPYTNLLTPPPPPPPDRGRPAQSEHMNREPSHRPPFVQAAAETPTPPSAAVSPRLLLGVRVRL
jgi:hypothetical protein